MQAKLRTSLPPNRWNDGRAKGYRAADRAGRRKRPSNRQRCLGGGPAAEIPSKVLARSRAPLVSPQPTEREGYVPNVVYSCGALRSGDQIILPYAVSDTFSLFATIKTAALKPALLA